jgi:hypothetical protein
MPSTKRYLTVLACGLVLCLSGTSMAAKGHEGHENQGHQVQKFSFPGNGWMLNPCPGVDKSAFQFDGTNVLRYHAQGGNVSIHLRFTGNAMHGDNPVKAYLHAHTHAEANAENSYDMPFESVWIEQGSPSFKLSGTVTAGFNPDGTPFALLRGDLPLQLVCSSDTGDGDRNRDNDRDDDKDKD